MREMIEDGEEKMKSTVDNDRINKLSSGSH